MKTCLWVWCLLWTTAFSVTRDYLSPEVGFVSVASWGTFLYDVPGGNKVTSLSVLQSVEVMAKTNIEVAGVVEEWYLVKVQIPQGIEEIVKKGWVRKKDLFSEMDLRVVKKIPEWFLLVYYPDNEIMVYHVLPTGNVKGYAASGEKFEDQLKVYQNVFSLGRVMLYYDGTNALVPWARRFDLITNSLLFPTEKNWSVSLFRRYELTGDRVNLRSFPSTNALILTQLAKGSEVIFLWKVGVREKIGGKWGFWSRVVISDKQGRDGYIFDAYLREK